LIVDGQTEQPIKERFDWQERCLLLLLLVPPSITSRRQLLAKPHGR
jgi:hypothetical protein